MNAAACVLLTFVAFISASAFVLFFIIRRWHTTPPGSASPRTMEETSGLLRQVAHLEEIQRRQQDTIERYQKLIAEMHADLERSRADGNLTEELVAVWYRELVMKLGPYRYDFDNRLNLAARGLLLNPGDPTSAKVFNAITEAKDKLLALLKARKNPEFAYPSERLPPG